MSEHTHETHLVERQRHPRNHEQRILRIHPLRETGHRVPPRNKSTPRPGRPRPARLPPPPLAQRAEKRILRHGHLHQTRPAVRHVRPCRRRTPGRRQSHHRRISRPLPHQLLHAKLPARPHPSFLPPAMGRRIPPPPQNPRSKKTRHLLRRPQRRTHRDRPCTSCRQQEKRRIHRRRTRRIRQAPLQRIRRHLPRIQQKRRQLYLVELHVQRARKKHRLAHRLFLHLTITTARTKKRLHTAGSPWSRPLPRRHGTAAVTNSTNT